MQDMELALALHAFAMMLLWVPFAIGAALSDKNQERRAYRVARRYHTRWDDPILHPRRTWREWRAWRVTHPHNALA